MAIHANWKFPSLLTVAQPGILQDLELALFSLTRMGLGEKLCISIMEREKVVGLLDGNAAPH